MLIEASLCTQWKVVSDSGARPLSVDIDPCTGRVSRTCHLGMVGSALEAEFELMTGQVTCVPIGPCDGPDFLFGCAFNRDQVGPQISETALAVDLCLSGPDDCGSSHNSIRPHLMVLELGRSLRFYPLRSPELSRLGHPCPRLKLSRPPSSWVMQS